MKSGIKICSNVFLVLLIVIMLLTGFYSISAKFSPDGTPTIKGYRLMIVLSGSMSPIFEAGDLIGVKDVDAATRISNGDIITFKDPEPGQNGRIVTHRVIEVINQDGTSFYKTKGDANDGADQQLVPSSNIIGMERFHIPYVGYFFNFAKSKTGLLVLVIIPGILVVASELRKMYILLKEEEERKAQETKEAEKV